MPNLKVPTNELLGELMSSLEEDQQEVRIKAFALAKKTFAKIRYSSHIQFLRKCLGKKLIPSGFQVNFHPTSLSRKSHYFLLFLSFDEVNNIIHETVT